MDSIHRYRRNLKKDKHGIVKKIQLVSLGVLIALGVPFSLINDVYASSFWDDIATPVSSLTVANGAGTHSSDISYTFMSIMKEQCYGAYLSLMSTNADPNGRMAIVQVRDSMNLDGPYRAVQIGWSSNLAHSVDFNTSANVYGRSSSVTVQVEQYIQLGINPDGETKCWAAPGNTLILGWDYLLHQYSVYSSNFPVNYPAGYTGQALPNVQDLDGDGLSLMAENNQGTSDLKKDTDGDGLDDKVESVGFSNREAVFCNTNAGPPYTCAYPNPTTKDIYIEIDWMTYGSSSFKPTTAQVAMVVDGLNDNGYNVHVDTGEFGGGNELNYIEYLPIDNNTTEINFFDLKDGNANKNVSGNFNTNRHGVWRYLVSGNGYSKDGENTSSTGASYAGSGNVFVSFGMIENGQPIYGYNDFDIAIAGTVVHEVGHSLCLSNTNSYTYQSNSCIFSGIDQFRSTTYDSSMNYSLQMFQYKLSNGVNGTDDHNDWAAIDQQGVADFAEWDMSDLVTAQGITASQVQDAIKNGDYGKLVKGDKVYDFRNNKMFDENKNKVYIIDANRDVIRESKDQKEWRDQLAPLLN